MQLARATLLIVAVLSITLLVQLLVVSSLQQAAAQDRLFDSFRADLARGTAPIGPADSDGAVLALGTPVAFIDIPSIGLRQVIVEGTTAEELFDGPGHRRDTPLPGQAGVSVLMGRRAGFGGPFGRLEELEPGDPVAVTTGQGEFTFRVIDVRAAGDPVPAPPAPGTSRLLLATAAGRPFLPEGAVRVDVELDGTAVIGPSRILENVDLLSAEQIMAGDTRTLWAMVLWIQVMIALALGAVWSWHRWGRTQTWVVFAPPLILVGLATSGEFARLLPNLA